MLWISGTCGDSKCCRSSGDDSPLEGLGVIDQHGELAVVEQVKRAEQLTADRDRFSFKCVGASLRQQSRCAGANGAWSEASLCRACPGTVSQRRVAMKVAGLTLRSNRQTSEYCYPFLINKLEDYPLLSPYL